MKGMLSNWILRIGAIALLSVATCALAQAPPPTHFNGLINDYSPATFVVAGVPKTVGPWEMRGKWSLNLHGASGTADFSAELNMELSDYAIVEGLVNVDTPPTRKPHTHHISMNGATVVQNPGLSPSGDCPASPAGTPGYAAQFELTGTADVTGNGGFAFSSVPLQVCIDGGAAAQFSNITLVFTIPEGGSNAAANHFGSQPIRGVVSKTN